MIYLGAILVLILFLWIVFKKDNPNEKETVDPLISIETAIENEFERVAVKSIKENPDPMFGAMLTYGLIGEAGKKMKQSLYSRFGGKIKKEILDKSVDKIQAKILKKYFENF